MVEDGKIFEVKSVIIVIGGSFKCIGIKGELEYWGKGVSICVICDGFFYKNKEVVVFGGGDIVVEEVIYLVNICKKVYFIYRRDGFRCVFIILEYVKNNDKIEFLIFYVVEEIKGDVFGVFFLSIKNIVINEIRELVVLGFFIFVGYDVNNVVLK